MATVQNAKCIDNNNKTQWLEGYNTYIDKNGKEIWTPKKHVDKTGGISWSSE